MLQNRKKIRTEKEIAGWMTDSLKAINCTQMARLSTMSNVMANIFDKNYSFAA